MRRSNCAMLHVTLWWLSVWASFFWVPQAGALHWCPCGFMKWSFCWLWRSSQWSGCVRQSPAVKGSWVSPTGAVWSSIPAQGCRDFANHCVSSSWAPPQSGRCPGSPARCTHGWRWALPADTEGSLMRQRLLDICQEEQKCSSGIALSNLWVFERSRRYSCKSGLTGLQLPALKAHRGSWLDETSSTKNLLRCVGRVLVLLRRRCSMLMKQESRNCSQIGQIAETYQTLELWRACCTFDEAPKLQGQLSWFQT